MKNHTKNRFFYVAKLPLKIPKLNQFRYKLGTGTKLEKLKNTHKNKHLQSFCEQNPVCKHQFRYKLPKLEKRQGISIRCYSHSVGKKTPSPYGRECPMEGNSSRSRVNRTRIIFSIEFGNRTVRAGQKVSQDFILRSNNGGNHA